MDIFFSVIYAFGALAGAASGVLAWIAKIRWSKEYIEAKNETIKAKEAQIERLAGEIKSVRELNNDIVTAKDERIATLREQTAPQVLELYKSTREALELAQGQFTRDLAVKDEQLSKALAGSTTTESDLTVLRTEKTELEEKLQGLKDALEAAQRAAMPAQALQDQLNHRTFMYMMTEQGYKHRISDMEDEISKLRTELQARTERSISGASLPSTGPPEQ